MMNLILFLVFFSKALILIKTLTKVILHLKFDVEWIVLVVLKEIHQTIIIIKSIQSFHITVT